MSGKTLQPTKEQEQKSTPTCVGFIMDGNRRWARSKSLPVFEGHRRGARIFKEAARWALEYEIPHIVFYAFSTENWKRSVDEVKYLMELIEKLFRDEIAEIEKEGVKIRFTGQRWRFSASIQKMMQEVETRSQNNKKMTLTVAVSYGGRAEIIDAINRILESGKKSIDEDVFKDFLWTTEMPDPDFIIRTGGERRLSNFLTWQSVYSELFFIDTYWPDFSKEEFEDILDQYRNRKRNFGK